MVSAIAQHLGRDRNTIRAHIIGDREPCVRRQPAEVDPFDAFESDVRQGFVEDTQEWAVLPFDEATAADNEHAQAMFTRRLRALQSRSRHYGQPIITTVFPRPGGENR